LSLCFNVSLTTALFFCVWGKKVFVALCWHGCMYT
jgi:hypothetical protein